MSTVTRPEIKIPEYIRANYCFGDTFQTMIEESIQLRTQTLPPENVIALNNIFNRLDSNHRALEESIQIMSSPKNSIKFWDTILESNNLSAEQRIKINSIKSILEDDAQPSNPQTRETIEGDGEDPTADQQPAQSGQPDQQEQSPDNSQGGDQEIQDPTANLSPDQVLQLELTQTNNKFMILTLYDKINELIDTIEIILDTVSSSKSEENLDLFESLKLYQDYLNIISELVFVMDINTVYYNYLNISIEVNDLLDKYLISSKVKVLNDDKSTPNEKKNVLEDLKQNLASKIEANKEIQDEGNN